MNSLHFGVNHLQRRPHNKIPTFSQVINSTKVKNKKGRRRSVHGTLTKNLLLAAGCWIVRVLGLKYSSTAQEREKP
jgi:hypothetical protein